MLRDPGNRPNLGSGRNVADIKLKHDGRSWTAQQLPQGDLFCYGCRLCPWFNCTELATDFHVRLLHLGPQSRKLPAVAEITLAAHGNGGIALGRYHDRSRGNTERQPNAFAVNQ